MREATPMPKNPLALDATPNVEAEKEVREPSQPCGHKLARRIEKGRSLNGARVSAKPKKQRANTSFGIPNLRFICHTKMRSRRRAQAHKICNATTNFSREPFSSNSHRVPSMKELLTGQSLVTSQ